MSDKPSQFGNGFESLAGFKAAKQFVEKPSPKPEVLSSQEKELQEQGREDEELSTGLVTAINLDTIAEFKGDKYKAAKFMLGVAYGDTEGYFRVQLLVTKSRQRDMSFELNRFLGSKLRIPRVKEIYNILLKRGYKAEAINWLKSLSSEEMQYGPKNQTVEEKRRIRIEKAKENAIKAGTTIEELAEQNNLTNLLHG